MGALGNADPKDWVILCIALCGTDGRACSCAEAQLVQSVSSGNHHGGNLAKPVVIFLYDAVFSDGKTFIFSGGRMVTSGMRILWLALRKMLRRR